MSKSELKEKGNSICDLIRMGDKHAFEDLYRKYYPALCELSRAITHNRFLSLGKGKKSSVQFTLPSSDGSGKAFTEST